MSGAFTFFAAEKVLLSAVPLTDGFTGERFSNADQRKKESRGIAPRDSSSIGYFTEA